jgi:hypothetical protein
MKVASDTLRAARGMSASISAHCCSIAGPDMQNDAISSGDIIYLDAAVARNGGLNKLGVGLFELFQSLVGVLIFSPIVIFAGVFLVSGMATAAERAAKFMHFTEIASWIRRSDMSSETLLFVLEAGTAGMLALTVLAFVVSWISPSDERNQDRYVIGPYGRTVFAIRRELEGYCRTIRRGPRRGRVSGFAFLAVAGVLLYAGITSFGYDQNARPTVYLLDEPGTFIDLVRRLTHNTVGSWTIVGTTISASILALLNAIRCFVSAPHRFLSVVFLNIVTHFLPAIFMIVISGIIAGGIALISQLDIFQNSTALSIPFFHWIQEQLPARNSWVYLVALLAIGFPFVFVLMIFLLGSAVFASAGVAVVLEPTKNWSRPTVRNALSGDSRAPILLLRSFQDDAAAVETLGINGKKKLVRIESMLATSIRRCYGPFLAIAQPGTLKAEGAARDYFQGEEWRTAVTDWMERARLIIVLAGSTPGLQWELKTLVARGHVGKLILLFPPDKAQATRRLQWVRIAFLGHPGFMQLGRVAADNVLAVHFRPDGRIAVVRGTTDDLEEFEASLHLAVYGLVGRGDR